MTGAHVFVKVRIPGDIDGREIMEVSFHLCGLAHYCIQIDPKNDSASGDE
ncbi:hypothetical protein [Natrinema gari]|nr:hypothetical protein [Natrinema gari]